MLRRSVICMCCPTPRIWVSRYRAGGDRELEKQSVPTVSVVVEFWRVLVPIVTSLDLPLFPRIITLRCRAQAWTVDKLNQSTVIT